MTFFVHIHTFSEKELISTKQDSVKNRMRCLHRSPGEVHVMFTSIGFRWQQHMFVKGLHKVCMQVAICDCIAMEITGSGNPTFLEGFIYAHQILPFPSNCTKDNFPSIYMAESKRFKLSEMYLPSPVFFRVAFSRTSSCNNVAVAVSEEQRQRIENYT